MNLEHYQILADLFDYPDVLFVEKTSQALSLLREKYPLAAKEVEIFYDQLFQKKLDSIQEIYTRSFDIQAMTTLDVGYVLFGDDYKRGEILSQLTREHQKVQNDCGRELADHLPNLLRLMSKSQDTELIHELAQEILAPALRTMIAEFELQRIAEKNKLYQKHYKTLIETSQAQARVYQQALKALFIVIKEDFGVSEESLNEYLHHDFFGSLKTEMSVEKIANE